LKVNNQATNLKEFALVGYQLSLVFGLRIEKI